MAGMLALAIGNNHNDSMRSFLVYFEKVEIEIARILLSSSKQTGGMTLLECSNVVFGEISSHVWNGIGVIAFCSWDWRWKWQW